LKLTPVDKERGLFMEESVQGVVSAAIRNESLEETMLREDGVREILARLERGEGIKRIARELGISKNTVRRWRRVGEWRRRVYERRPRKLDRFAAFVERRGAEVGWNGAVLFRELRQLGYDGGSLQVRRYVQPLRERNRLTDVATVRFETGPGEQAREDILEYAWRLCRANGGAPGVDGERFTDIEARGVEEWLGGLGKELRERTYRASPVRRVMIPKPGGGERPLGIPTIRDRVVQTAAKLVLEPIFEVDLEPNAYGYRPRTSAHDAVREVHRSLCEGYLAGYGKTQCVDGQ
jgi:hypothetical protein